MCLHPHALYRSCGHIEPTGPVERCYDESTDPHHLTTECLYYQAGLRFRVEGFCPSCGDERDDVGNEIAGIGLGRPGEEKGGQSEEDGEGTRTT
ncbi:hypothetical protein PMIN01_04162 [Paraphaeosphaeria minitans]|uniref:Uncharacterized protein n=1 Tax=Paraphaeosphaeria minitans TaxID=565426 RepID=A0A9P6KUK0_9PLEO|nr:hypothetical protein PMIN01_04162 [Paraphaeosphaeria minitans]